ncbi:G patch domain-containing protein 1 isoform X1 [Solea solea]|uniref:G patch domain-containing protein 1 isoform X1 n=1 Tax=Solea solea TaxID=90069 RepID=UPI00272CCFEE|nr:G patch domain-containing protein 1 isoform X1 [Solea solea]
MASDSEEDFVVYGSPLEPLDEDEPRKKPIPLHEQTVKDEKGRYQRFHGAFTGGFSAGYFNSVGSKEGWTPSTFISSRQQKAENHNARPEDFMDEEDFSEHGIAPSQITTSQEFSSGCRDEVREKSRAVISQMALIPGDTLLEELITPARSSIGVELLRRMGWKEGQGIGPRVKRKLRQRQKGGARVNSCARPHIGSEESEDDDDEEFAPENVTFAPVDVTPVDFSPRSGVQGLGYRGLNPGLALLGHGAAEHINLFNPESETRSKLFGDAQKTSRKGKISGQAFGVGALEDNDDDVYHKDSMTRYDTVLGGEEPGDGLYGWTAPQQYNKRRDTSKALTYLGKIPEGFTVALKLAKEKMIFPPPVLPPDFRPVHGFHPSLLGTTAVSSVLRQALATSRGHMVKEEPQQGGRHQLDSSQRRALLGEDVLHSSSSVMELLRPEDRQRLFNLHNDSKTTSAKCQNAIQPGGSVTRSTVVSLTQPLPQSCSTPSSSLQEDSLASWRGVQSSTQTFRPFVKNPSKQARYEQFLSRLKHGDKDAVEQSLDPGMTEWERSRERDEFLRASILYKPTSSSLSSRFTVAQHQEDDDAVEVSRDEEGDVDNKQDAVKMKMFGKLTREMFEWHPDKLLCKRFNVPDAYPGSGVVGLPKVKRDKFSVFNFLNVTESREMTAPLKPPETRKKSRWDVSEQEELDKEEELPTSATTASPNSISDQTQAQKGKEDDEEEQQKEEEVSRPPMDLFKAIFASSDDDSSSSEVESEEEDTKEGEGKNDLHPLNLFNVPSTSVTSSITSCSSQQTVTPVVFSQPSMQEEFGPSLPPPSGTDTRGSATSHCSSSTENKQRKKNKEKKVKKKEGKHKKDKKKKKQKKHKHKEKHQKKIKEEEISDEDSEGHVSTEELLKRLKSIP